MSSAAATAGEHASQNKATCFSCHTLAITLVLTTDLSNLQCKGKRGKFTALAAGQSEMLQCRQWPEF